MLYIRTCAYNAEKYIRRTIESILNQTYSDFLYYILDNGSSDDTRKIIQEYAEKDKRIVPFYCNENHNHTLNKEFWTLAHRLEDEDLFCCLDADDYYEHDFLKEVIGFLKEQCLDIAICGTRFIDDISGEISGERVFAKNCVLESAADYDMFFPEVHWNLRQVWGKVYTGKAVKVKYEVDLPDWFPRAYGGDTANVYECVKVSERIGVLAKCLHSYTVSPKSVSYKWIEGREQCDFTLFEKAEELLIQKCGHVSPRNLNFLYAVQFNALRDTLMVLGKAMLPSERKVEIMKGIFENPITRQTFLEEGNVAQEEKTNLLVDVVCGVIEMAQNIAESSLQDITDIFNVFNPNFSELIPLEQLGWYIKNLPMLVRNVAMGEYEYGVNNLLVYLAKGEKDRPTVDYPMVLGQVLASLREEDTKYVFFSKQLIYWCIENHQQERARRDLDEWLQILPEDKQLKELDQMC